VGEPILEREYYSAAAYLELIECLEGKYEYESGRVVGIGSTTETHHDIVFNATNFLKQATRGKGCLVNFETLKLQGQPNGPYYIPGNSPCFRLTRAPKKKSLRKSEGKNFRFQTRI